MNSPTPPSGDVPAATAATSAWRSQLSADWLAQAARLEAMLDPVDEPLLAAAALRPGESVVDIGCGRGPTTRRAAVAVGELGKVVGVDVGEDVIGAAGAIASPAGAAAMHWVAADAAALQLDTQVDVVISRFGVMFFEDPAAAFANLRLMVHDAGRLAVAVWQPRTASEFQRRSLEVAVAAAARRGIDLALPEPLSGPFRYGDPAWFGAVLDQSGWCSVAMQSIHLGLYVGGPGTTPSAAAALGMSNGPLAMLTSSLDPESRTAVQSAVEADLAQAWDGEGVRLDAAITIVTATATVAAATTGIAR